MGVAVWFVKTGFREAKIMLKRVCFLAVSAILVSFFAGCTQESTVSRPYQSGSMGDADQGAVFAAGERVMRAEFGQVVVDRDGGVIESKPTFSQGTTMALSTQPQLRRRAKLAVRQRRGSWWADVQVVSERRDTEAVQHYQYQRAGKDTDIPTPMETGEPMVDAGREFWVQVGRERDLERELILRMREELGISR